MKAAYIPVTGSTSEICWGDLPVPVPKDNEVLIKVEAVAVNYVDTFVRSGLYKTELSFPFILGRDAIGTIIQVGKYVQKFKIGDRVWTNSMGYEGRQGVTSQLASIPEERAFLAPEQANPYQLIGAVHSATTAQIALQDVMNLKSGQWILIEGAAGQVGQKFVYLANKMGAHIVTTSHPRHFQDLVKLGAQQTFSYHDEKLLEHLGNLKPTGFDHIVDTSGQVALQDNLDLLGLHGTLTMITKPKNSDWNPQAFYMKSQSIKGFVISQASLEQLQDAATILNEYFVQGHLLEKNIRLLPASQAQSAHELLETKAEKNKIVLTFYD